MWEQQQPTNKQNKNGHLCSVQEVCKKASPDPSVASKPTELAFSYHFHTHTWKVGHVMVPERISGSVVKVSKGLEGRNKEGRKAKAGIGF